MSRDSGKLSRNIQHLILLRAMLYGEKINTKYTRAAKLLHITHTTESFDFYERNDAVLSLQKNLNALKSRETCFNFQSTIHL